MSLDGIYFKLFPIEYCEFRIEKQLGNSRSRHTGGFFLSRIFSSTLTVLLFVSGGEELNMFPHRPPQSTQLSADGRFALWHIILTANSFHGCELFCLNNLLHWHKQDLLTPAQQETEEKSFQSMSSSATKCEARSLKLAPSCKARPWHYSKVHDILGTRCAVKNNCFHFYNTESQQNSFTYIISFDSNNNPVR